MLKYAFAVFSLALSTSLSAFEFEPYVAHYDLIRGDDKVGEGSRTLERLADDQFRLSYQTKGSIFIYKDKRKERVDFDVAGGQIAPFEYEYEQETTFKDKYYNLAIDQQNKVVTDKTSDKTMPLSWEGIMLDHLGYQVQLRIDASEDRQNYSYQTVSQKGSSKTYDLQLVGKETLTTALGEIETLKIKRESGSRITYAWLSLEHKKVLVKLQQFRKGVEQYQAHITSLEFNPVPAAQQ